MLKISIKFASLLIRFTVEDVFHYFRYDDDDALFSHLHSDVFVWLQCGTPLTPLESTLLGLSVIRRKSVASTWWTTSGFSSGGSSWKIESKVFHCCCCWCFSTTSFAASDPHADITTTTTTWSGYAELELCSLHEWPLQPDEQSWTHSRWPDDPLRLSPISCWVTFLNNQQNSSQATAWRPHIISSTQDSVCV